MGKKVLREYNFHSRDLLPWETAVKKIDEAIKYFENGNGKVHFIPGDEVAHKDNLEQKMIVKEIIRKVVKVKTDVLDEDNKPVEVTKKLVQGIRCYWFE